MKNKLLKNIKKSIKKNKAKGMLLIEIADDFMDIIQNAKVYKKINKKRKN